MVISALIVLILLCFYCLNKSFINRTNNQDDVVYEKINYMPNKNDKTNINIVNTKCLAVPDNSIEKKYIIQIFANLIIELSAKKIYDLDKIQASDTDLNNLFNDYYKSALILVPDSEETHALEPSSKNIIISDVIKPISRIEYESLLKQAVPKDVYANSYTSRKCSYFPKDYIVFDTETTGLEIDIDRIIEIGAIKYINHIPIERFHVFINPDRDFDDFIVELTGISKEQLKISPKIENVLPLFYNFIEDYVLIAHNAPFDVKIIACEAYRSQQPMFDNLIIDSLTLAKRCIPKTDIENYKLETIKKYFGLVNDSHRALDDCETCSAIYQYYLTKIEK